MLLIELDSLHRQSRGFLSSDGHGLGRRGWLQPAKGCHGFEDLIIMPQRQLFHDEQGGDADIDCFTDGSAGFSKAAAILNALNGNSVSTDATKLQRERFGSFFCRPFKLYFVFSARHLINRCPSLRVPLSMTQHCWAERRSGIRSVRAQYGSGKYRPYRVDACEKCLTWVDGQRSNCSSRYETLNGYHH